MNLTFHGAAGGQVTGSAYLIETETARVLVDCGLFQGGRAADLLNKAPGGRTAANLDAVVLTHGHLDHTGRLPLLSRAGFTGPIHTTPATVEMAGLILRDAAKVQLQDGERKNRKRQRAGLAPEPPLFESADVERILRQFRPVPYHQPVPVASGIEVTFLEAGHMLGSACLQVRVREGTREQCLVFSGDLGPRGAPILKDAETFHDADAVILESTYGDRDHRPFRETVDEFVEILRRATREGGRMIVPTFAVGRAQTLTLLLAWVFRKRLVKPFPVFLDSPMAIEAWKIYQRHHELFDEDMVAFLNEGSLQKDLATLRMASTADESKRINDVEGPCLIMAGAGMCNAGRILHHLKAGLWKPSTHVIIVGFQAAGSLGRRLVDGESNVKIHGEVIAVKGTVHTLGGFSAHAGQTDLLTWFSPLAAARPKVFLTHGEDGPRRALAAQLTQRHRLKPVLPGLGETHSL